MSRLLIAALALFSIFVLAGCANGETASSEPELITGYIYIQGNELLVDVVEIITGDDAERIKELELTESDYPSGYFIYNAERDKISLELTRETSYIFTDFNQLYNKDEAGDRQYETKNIEEFIEGSCYQDINLDNIELDRHYIPYFIEVVDGKVISITEEFMYTI